MHRHFTRESTAQQFDNELRTARVGAAAVVAPERHTARSYAEQWRLSQTSKDPDAARHALERAYAGIGDATLTAVTGARLHELQLALLERFAPSTVEQTMYFVARALRQAHHDGLIDDDPAAGLDLGHRHWRDRRGTVTPDQFPTREEALAIMPPRRRHIGQV